MNLVIQGTPYTNHVPPTEVFLAISGQSAANIRGTWHTLSSRGARSPVHIPKALTTKNTSGPLENSENWERLGYAITQLI